MLPGDMLSAMISHYVQESEAHRRRELSGTCRRQECNGRFAGMWEMLVKAAKVAGLDEEWLSEECSDRVIAMAD